MRLGIRMARCGMGLRCGGGVEGLRGGEPGEAGEGDGVPPYHEGAGLFAALGALAGMGL
jgi:hypothetical protein